MFLSTRVRWRILGNWRLYAEAVIYINIALLFSILNACITPRSKCEEAAAEQGHTTGVHSVRCTSAFERVLRSDRCEILGLIRKYRKLHNTLVNQVFSVLLTLIALARRISAEFKNTRGRLDTANTHLVEF